MTSSNDVCSGSETFLEVQRLHKEALRAGLQEEDARSSILGGQSVRDVILKNFYAPLSVREQEDGGRASADNGACTTLQELISQAFRPDTEGQGLVLCGGVGMGKTTCVERLVWDWASGERLQHFTLLLKVCVRELLTSRETSLQRALLRRHAHFSAESLSSAFQRPHTLLLVIDGLDSLQDVPSTELVYEPLQSAPGLTVLASLLRGSLLPSVALLVTSRQPVDLESARCAQVLGFSADQRKTFFRRVFSDAEGAEQALRQCQRVLGLCELCVCPAFCWTVCCVFKEHLERGEALPETLTQLLGVVVVTLLRELGVSVEQGRALCVGLGRLASRCAPFTHTPTSPYMHTSCSLDDMTACGLQPFLDSRSLSAFLRATHDDITSPDIRFSFLSPIMQEFLLAALFYLDQSEQGVDEVLGQRSEICDVFLTGLSDPSQRKLLEESVGVFKNERASEFRQGLKAWVAMALKSIDIKSHCRCLRLLHHCSAALVRDYVTPDTWRAISYSDLQDTDFVALAHVVSSLGGLDTLNLYCSSLTEKQVLSLTPAIRLAHKIILSQSSFSVGVVSHLAAALTDSRVVELDLSYSRLGDAAMKILCPALTHSNLHTLSIPVCQLTASCCEALAAMLTESPKLRILDLRGNELLGEGFSLICKALSSPHCKLEELSLHSCGLTGASVPALSSALASGRSTLRSLDLTRNAVTDEGLELLAKALREGSSLRKLLLYSCELTGSCCSAVAAALKSGACPLTELDLSVNELGQSGAMLICDALKTGNHSLEKLSLIRCELTEVVFSELRRALDLEGCGLKELSVGVNDVGDAGVKHLWAILKRPYCKLQLLDIEMVGLTDSSVEEMCQAVRACPSLTTLILKNNMLTDAAIPPLVQLMKERLTMEELNLQYNDFSEDLLELMDTCPNIRY